ncbi:MAG: hypothetical protein PHV32_06675 [Eubacteriales bacterium]|nr:hypothetical protein [Eubacteriales bacterium]
MIKDPKIVIVGGGSLTFSPKLINDFMLTAGLENAHYELLDIDIKAAKRIAQLGKVLNEARGTNCSFSYTDRQCEALEDADFVLITISTGGLDAMRYDLEIPEDYGVFQTVGDTVGPGGWARALRNIPVFQDLTRDIEKICPGAFVLNYTNPMSVLTNVFYKTSKLKTVGLCHGVFETIDALKRILGFKNREDCKLKFAGVNHFFWILDFDVKGTNGYELLKEKTGGKKLSDVTPELDPLFCSLYEQLGYLSYSEDRHTCEFFPQYLTGDIKKLEKYKLKRTTIDERKGWMREKSQELDDYISGDKKLPDTFSGEAAADIIGSIAANRSRVDVVNVPNEGQIPNLPLGTIVETMGVIDGLGFRPLHAGKLPEPLLNFVLPHALNQNLIIEASLEGDLDKALYALYTDPLCAHLDFDDIKEMGMKLLSANKKYLPQFRIGTK